MLFICVRIPDYKHNNIVEPLIPGSGYTTLPFDCVIRISSFAVFKNVNLALFDILCIIRDLAIFEFQNSMVVCLQQGSKCKIIN